jgi:predicted lipase
LQQQQVRVLAAAGKVEQGLLQQAMKYRSMPHDERQQLCSYLQECVGHLLGAEAAAGAKAQARSVAPAYGARAR